jgi:hypothetical protein
MPSATCSALSNCLRVSELQAVQTCIQPVSAHLSVLISTWDDDQATAVHTGTEIIEGVRSNDTHTLQSLQ